MKFLLIVMLYLIELHAVNLNALYGKWYSTEQTTNQGTVTIEKDVQLFHKAKKNGLGGVIVLMANAGFSIKGHIQSGD